MLLHLPIHVPNIVRKLTFASALTSLSLSLSSSTSSSSPSPGCWENDLRISEWMLEQGFGSDYSKLFQYFVDRIDAAVRARNKTVVHWMDVFDANITTAPNSIFQVWKNATDLRAVVQAGHRAILSNSDAWYLNCGVNPTCPYASCASFSALFSSFV